MPHCAAFAGPSGPAFFFFCLSPVSLNRLFLSGDETSFLSPGVGCCPWIRPQPGHTGPTELIQGFGGVVPLPRPLTGQKSPHRGEFGFSPQNGFTPPPKGGGAGYHLSWVVGFALLVHNWLTRLQQGLFGAALVSLPYLAFKIAHRAAQGRVWFRLAGWRF